MDIALWVAQVVLALAFVGAGFTHAFRFDQMLTNARMAWAGDVGRPGMRAIGLLEIAGSIGLVLPALTGILPWLTPTAAAGLVFLMLSAAVFHARRGEFQSIVPNAALGAIALFVAWGRFVAAPFYADQTRSRLCDLTATGSSPTSPHPRSRRSHAATRDRGFAVVASEPIEGPDSVRQRNVMRTHVLK